VDPTNITNNDEVNNHFEGIEERIDQLFEELDELKVSISKIKTEL